MKQVSFRLRGGEMLKERIEEIAREQNIKAGVLLSVVGAVKPAVLRMAGATPEDQPIKTWDEPLEIVSGTGTISREGCHIHASFSRKDGTVIGGHLKDGCIVDLTAEVVLGVFEDVTYERVYDNATGFKELHIS